MQLHLAGFTVIRCSIAFPFRLELARPARMLRSQEHAQEQASVVIAAPFDYVVDGTPVRLQDEQHPQELGRTLTLVDRMVKDSTTADDGALHLRFSGQASLRVPSLPKYEAMRTHRR